MRAIAAVFLIACGAAGPAPGAAPAGAKLEIVEGKPATLSDGTVVAVADVTYAHLEDSKNLSLCKLVVRRDGKTVELPLAREHGGSDPASAGSALGWEFTLEVADPYSKPSRVITRIRKL